jgi:hypothetical protein
VVFAGPGDTACSVRFVLAEQVYEEITGMDGMKKSPCVILLNTAD